MTLSGEMIAFILLAAVAVIGGLLLINLTKVVHMVISLVFTFLSIAGLFLLLSAEFAAVVQVLIYSGAVTIIMLFGIMLTRHDEEKDGEKRFPWRKGVLLLAIAGIGWAVYAGIYNLDFPVQQTDFHENNTEKIGVSLFSEYVIPFELASVILLAALMGAVVLAKKDDEEGDQP